MYYIYILKSNAGKIYIGQTTNIERRLEEHNTSGSGYTAKFRPWELIYTESFLSRKESMAREKYLKSGVGRDWIHNIVLGA